MIGSIFWTGLLVYFVPLWFMHPVDFSPNSPKHSVISLATETTTTELATAAVESAVQQQEARSTLFIDKPLTVTPPPADPVRVQALHQTLSAREGQVDVQGRLKGASQLVKVFGPAPEVVPGGRFSVQIATYSQESFALETQSRLRVVGIISKITISTNKKARKIYLLRAGPYKSLDDAKKAKDIIDVRTNAKSVVLGK
jgi:cell division protein FtsN